MRVFFKENWIWVLHVGPDALFRDVEGKERYRSLAY